MAPDLHRINLELSKFGEMLWKFRFCICWINVSKGIYPVYVIFMYDNFQKQWHILDK
jgi:hypothetical protein